MTVYTRKSLPSDDFGPRNPSYETSKGINTDNYTTEEILDEISNLESQKSSIEREIDLFDQYCTKFGIPDIPLPSENVEKLSSRKKKRQNQEKKLEKLNISQKNDIVSKLIDSEIKEKVRVRSFSEFSFSNRGLRIVVHGQSP